MPSRLVIFICFFTLLTVGVTKHVWADTPPICPAVEDPTALGGVTRAERFDQTVHINLPITQFYCGNGAANALNPSGNDDASIPTLDQIENDYCSSTTVEANIAMCQQNPQSTDCKCVYWKQTGANCPTTKDDPTKSSQDQEKNREALTQMKQKIKDAVMAQLSAREIGASQNTNTNLKTEADTIHEGAQTKIRTPAQAADPTFVNSTVGETAKAIGDNKVYYAGCFNLDLSDLGIQTVETGWFTMTKNNPLSGIVPPSFKKETAIMTNLQNSITQLPGVDPVIKALQDQEPQFSNDATSQTDFPKISLTLASKKEDGSKNKFLIYWKLCTARGVSSCDISNFITDFEDLKNKQTVVGTTPTADWGRYTSLPDTGDYQCFTTGDLNTGPLEVNSDIYSNYFGVRTKIVGQASDQVQKVAAPHCQNSAEVTAYVSLNSGSSDISFGGGNFAAVAYCPEYDYVKPADVPNFLDPSSYKMYLNGLAGLVKLETITRLFNVAKDKILSIFEWHTTVEAPPQERATCEALTNQLCGPSTAGSSTGTKLSISHTVTPSRITPAAGSTAVPVSVEIKVVNNSADDATNVDVVSIWTNGTSVSNIKKDDGTEVPGRQVSWHIDRIPGNNTTDNTTILSYTATVDATTQTVYRLQDFIYADVVSEQPLTASQTKIPFVVGSAAATTPVVADSGGLQIRETIDPASATVNGIDMQLVMVSLTVKNTSGQTISNATARSTWDPVSGVIVNSDGGAGSSFATGGMSWQLGDLIAGEEVNFSYSLYFNLSHNQLYSGTATVTGTSLVSNRETAIRADAAITVGQSTSLCEKIAWMICYFTSIPDYLTRPQNNYVKDVVIHTYPYPNVAYTGALQTDAASGRDGYYNFALPPQDEYSKLHAQQELTNDVAGTPYVTKTEVLGANEVKKDQTKIMREYLTPPGQTPPPAIVTATDDNIGAASCATPPPVTIPPGENAAFTLAACNNLSVPARSGYTENILEQAAATEGVPVNLLAAILFAEYRSAYTATGPSATCNPGVCAAYGWFQITCGYENVTCAAQNPTNHCSDFYCCDTNGDGVKDSVCPEYQGWFACPVGATAADLCDPAKAAVLAAQKLKGKIGVDRVHLWTANDVCRAAAKYFGASGNCDTSGGSYPSLGGCTYGHYAREFVTAAGL